MTRERKTSILALIMICIVCLFLAGCVTKRKVMTETASSIMETSKMEQEKDTTIVETHDTTKVSQRLVPIEVEIPAANKERTTTDTTSVLETDLYKSTATWSNGKLKHTLEAKPGAKVKGQTAVSDTTRTSTKNEKSKNTRNTSTDSKSQQKDTQEVKTTTKQASWSEWLTTGIIIGTTATIAIIWRWRKRKRTKTQQA
mgnify:CR=1 FL=1